MPVVNTEGNDVLAAIQAQQQALQGYLAGMEQLNSGFRSLNQSLQFNKSLQLQREQLEENKRQFALAHEQQIHEFQKTHALAMDRLVHDRERLDFDRDKFVATEKRLNAALALQEDMFSEETRQKNIGFMADAILEIYPNIREAARDENARPMMEAYYRYLGLNGSQTKKVIKAAGDYFLPEDVLLQDSKLYLTDGTRMNEMVVGAEARLKELEAIRATTERFESPEPLEATAGGALATDDGETGAADVRAPEAKLTVTRFGALTPRVMGKFRSAALPWARQAREFYRGELEKLSPEKQEEQLETLDKRALENPELFIKPAMEFASDLFPGAQWDKEDYGYSELSEEEKNIADHLALNLANFTHTEDVGAAGQALSLTASRETVYETEKTEEAIAEVRARVGERLHEGMVEAEKAAEATGASSAEQKAESFRVLSEEAAARLRELGLQAEAGRVTEEQFDTWTEEILSDAETTPGRLRASAGATRSETTRALAQSSEMRALENRIARGVYRLGDDPTALLRGFPYSDTVKQLMVLSEQYTLDREDAKANLEAQGQIKVLLAEKEGIAHALQSQLEILSEFMKNTELLDEPKKMLQNPIFSSAWNAVQGLAALQGNLPIDADSVEIRKWFLGKKEQVDFLLLGFNQEAARLQGGLTALQGEQEAIAERSGTYQDLLTEFMGATPQ